MWWDVLNSIGVVILAGVSFLLFLFKSASKSYVDKKAENLATAEDVEKITGKIEQIKSENEKSNHAWKWVYEKEYAVMQSVWDAAYDMQAKARGLEPLLDSYPDDEKERQAVFNERYEDFLASVTAFHQSVIKVKPFMPPNVYEVAVELREITFGLQYDFAKSQRYSREPDWDKKLELNEKCEQCIEKLCDVIRRQIIWHGQNV